MSRKTITTKAVAVPSELTMPNDRKNGTKINGNMIFSIVIAVFLDSTKPARLLAMNMESSIDDSVENRVKAIKAAKNTGLSLMKPSAGDQR